jgi:transcriptional regulator with XRE-family HTH domain
MEEPSMNIGERLKSLRTAKKLSQGDVEERTGLLRCYVSRVENGHTVPNLETLERWTTALEVEVYQLFYKGEGKPEAVIVGSGEAMDKSEEELLGFFRQAHRAEKRLILQVARELAGRMS